MLIFPYPLLALVKIDATTFEVNMTKSFSRDFEKAVSATIEGTIT